MKHKQQDSQEIIKELDKAGAGISFLKKILAKYLAFPLLNRFISWEKAWNIFDKEGAKIIQLSSTLDKEKLFKRVLVPKLFGLEDNSRYYSVAMVLQHLIMVGGALQLRIPHLSQGKKPKKNVKIEDVKPYKEIDENILEEFEKFLANYRGYIEENIENIHIDNSSTHPWFGEFNPKQWSILGMVHHIVHRRQIEAILKNL